MEEKKRMADKSAIDQVVDEILGSVKSIFTTINEFKIPDQDKALIKRAVVGEVIEAIRACRPEVTDHGN
jgi:hypothetical protein